MRQRLFYFLLLLCPACNLTDDEERLNLLPEDKLQEIFSMPLEWPTGELHRVVTYGGSTDNVQAIREIFYLENEEITYHVLKNNEKDTTGIGLNYFEDKKVITSHYFSYSTGSINWVFTREYQYNFEGQLDRMFTTNAHQEKSLVAQYNNDQDGRLIEIEYPFETGAELEVFEYDESDRITARWRAVRGNEDRKLEYLRYRYNGELLVAKLAGERGSNELGTQDAYRFYYDEEQRLVKEKKFDPNFGFQQASSSEYFYIGEGE